MPNGGWQTPYGTVSREGGYAEWQRRMAAQPPAAPATADPWWLQTLGYWPWKEQLAEGAQGGLDLLASLQAGARNLLPQNWTPGMIAAPPGSPADTHPAWYQGQPPGAPGEGLEYLDIVRGALGPGQAGAPVGAIPPGYPTGMRPPALGVAPGLYPPGAGAPTAPGAPAGGAGARAGGGAGGRGGAFGPFGSIEEWRNQFYAEHGRWPNDADAQDAIASFGFLAQTGRSPTQQEWEGRWGAGYGGTPQWGPVGYGGGGRGGGWKPPPQPSWWGGEVLGEEGWTYLPTKMGQWPDKPPEREESKLPDWYDIKTMRSFQQVPPQWRDWLQQVMQGQQQYWENPLMAPIQWAQPAQSEL